jgi:uncharacterized RDD family membrane protein YckC
MRQLRVVTPEGLVLRREVAGAGSRFCAAAIDGLLVLLAILALLLGVLLAAQMDPTGLSGFLTGILGGGSLLLLIGYQLGFALLWKGQTPGKRALGLRVVSANGWPASTTQHLLRSLLWPIDVFLPVPVPFGLLGLVVVLTTERRQRLGDLVAGTLVLREASERAPSEPLAGKRWSQLEARQLALAPGLVARLDEDDRVFLRELLSRRGLDASQRRRLATAAARHYAERLELAVPAEPETALQELYLHLREARE